IEEYVAVHISTRATSLSTQSYPFGIALQQQVACPLRVDAVEKVGATLTTRNNRIVQAGFLNRSCAFDARLESILLEDPLKIFFREYRSRAERLASSKCSPLFPQ